MKAVKIVWKYVFLITFLLVMCNYTIVNYTKNEFTKMYCCLLVGIVLIATIIEVSWKLMKNRQS
jgi:hypothetical protein